MMKVGAVLSFDSISTCETADEALKIWRNRPNVVNRRLCGSSEIWTPDIGDSRSDIVDSLVQKLKDDLVQLSSDDISELKNVLGLIAGENEPSLSKYRSQGGNCHRKVDHNISVMPEGDEYILSNGRQNSQGDVMFNHVMLRKLLPRSLVKFRTTIEIVATTLDSGKLSACLFEKPLV